MLFLGYYTCKFYSIGLYGQLSQMPLNYPEKYRKVVHCFPWNRFRRRLVILLRVLCFFIWNKSKLVFVKNIKFFQQRKQTVGNDFFNNFR